MLQILTFTFKGKFNQYGFTEVKAPTEAEAWRIFTGIDQGNGFGIAPSGEVCRVENHGPAYKFDGDIEAWREAVKKGEVA